MVGIISSNQLFKKIYSTVAIVKNSWPFLFLYQFMELFLLYFKIPTENILQIR